jgi:hypothetical protein
MSKYSAAILGYIAVWFAELTFVDCTWIQSVHKKSCPAMIGENILNQGPLKSNLKSFCTWCSNASSTGERIGLQIKVNSRLVDFVDTNAPSYSLFESHRECLMKTPEFKHRSSRSCTSLLRLNRPIVPNAKISNPSPKSILEKRTSSLKFGTPNPLPVPDDNALATRNGITASRKGPRCKATGCEKGAYFASLGERKRPEWCAKHRRRGQLNVRDKRCQYPEVQIILSEVQTINFLNLFTCSTNHASDQPSL